MSMATLKLHIVEHMTHNYSSAVQTYTLSNSPINTFWLILTMAIMANRIGASPNKNKEDSNHDLDRQYERWHLNLWRNQEYRITSMGMVRSSNNWREQQQAKQTPTLTPTPTLTLRYYSRPRTLTLINSNNNHINTLIPSLMPTTTIISNPTRNISITRMVMASTCKCRHPITATSTAIVKSTSIVTTIAIVI